MSDELPLDSLMDTPSTFPSTIIPRRIALKLISKTKVSHDTKLYRFALPSEKHRLSVPIGNFVLAFAKKYYIVTYHRAYTPISSNHELGFMDLIVKTYFPDDSSVSYIGSFFPSSGGMSMVFENLQVGEYMEFAGPFGHIEHKVHQFGVNMSYYYPKWRFQKNLMERKNVNKIGMIAGGTGIAPMLQLIREIFRKKDSSEMVNTTTEVVLIFSNRTNDDILCRQELDNLAKEFTERFTIIYTLTRGDWTEEDKSTTTTNNLQNIIKITGRVNKNMIEQYMPRHDEEDSFILLSGRSAMVKDTCHKSLEEIGWDMKKVYCY